MPQQKERGRIPIAFLGGVTLLNAAWSPYWAHQSRIALDRWVLPLDPYLFFLYHGWNDPQVQEDGYGDDGKCRRVLGDAASLLAAFRPTTPPTPGDG